MQEGECVIFNNRRVLHGRKAFDAEGGERWLKGAYVDTDVLMSRWRVLNEKYKAQGDEIIQGITAKWPRRKPDLEKDPRNVERKSRNVIDYGPRFTKKKDRKLSSPILSASSEP
jgi:hypothetical protein